jgi:hypothetical protein
MQDTKELIDSLRNAKLEARASGDTLEAIEELRDAVSLVDASWAGMSNGVENPEKLSQSLAELASETADCCGMSGGIYWRMHRSDDPHLDEAEECYERGAKWEERGNYYYPNSYNLVNRIVVKILKHPNNFQQWSTDLRELASTVHAQTHGGGREHQWWAWADLGLISLLTSNSVLEEEGYEKFRATGPKHRNYMSTTRVMDELSTALRESAPTISTALRERSRKLMDAAPPA